MKFIFWGFLSFLSITSLAFAKEALRVEENTTQIIAPTNSSFLNLSERDQTKFLKTAQKSLKNKDNKKNQLIKKYKNKSSKELIRQKKSLTEWLARTEKKGNKERAEKIRMEIEVLTTLLNERSTLKKQ